MVLPAESSANEDGTHSSNEEQRKFDYALKQHFNFPLLVSTDVKLLINRYGSLRTSIEELPKPARVIIRGTIPFVFCSTIYHCPVRIVVGERYPYAVPCISVAQTKFVRLMDNHPNLGVNGVVRMPYLERWTRKSTLLEAVRLMQKIFNKHCPVYTLKVPETSTSTTTPKEQSKGRSLFTRKSKGMETISKGIQSAVSKIAKHGLLKMHDEEGLATATQVIVRKLEHDYLKNKNKLEVHRLCLNMWIPVLVDVGSSLKSQYNSNSTLHEQLQKEQDQLQELESIKKSLTDFIATMNEMEQKEADTSNADVVTEILDSLSASSQNGEMSLCSLLGKEAASDSMLEFLVEVFKRKLMCTKDYINHVRAITRDKFYHVQERLNAIKNT